MQISFLIVTKNRPEALAHTLNKLKVLIDPAQHEVLVCVDNCDETIPILSEFEWVKWEVSTKSLGASPARALLYQKAKGTYFIGLDDDAHPVSEDFIASVVAAFKANSNIGIIAFQEIRGLFENDTIALQNAKKLTAFKTNDFVGCGFAISKDVYLKTNGFPVWIDIYGEEPALALEVLNLGYDIWYQPDIKVNHRVDIEKRKQLGRNYFRFEKQLKNTIYFFIVYYPKPYVKILKVLLHNFTKYALKDLIYFKLYVSVVFKVLIRCRQILKYRNPVKPQAIIKRVTLKPILYS